MSKIGKLAWFITHCDMGFVVGLLIWLVVAAIETAIISFVVAAIAKSIFEKDFWEVFGGSLVVVGALEIILGIMSLFS